MKSQIDRAVEEAWKKWMQPVSRGKCAEVSPVFCRGFHEGVLYATRLLRRKINLQPRRRK
jgi:hypothetical protein